MSVRLRTPAVVLVAAVALATSWAFAAAVQPATHQFVKGEHFRYSNVLTLGGGPGVVILNGSQKMAAVEDIDVVDVSPSGVTFKDHVEHDKATDFGASTSTVHAVPDGTWRFEDGRVMENTVTWDPVQLGPQLPALTVGQQWEVDTAPSLSFVEPGHAVVRVVSVDPDNVALHVEGTLPPSRTGAFNITKTWSADVAFAHGIVREFHRVDVQHIDRGPGTRVFDNPTDRLIRLLEHTTP